MLLNRRAVWGLAILLGLILIVNVILIVAVFWVAGLDRQGLYRDQIRQDLGLAITNVVDRILTDVQFPTQSKSSADAVKESPKDRMIEAQISTMGADVWLNGQRFSIGSFVAPYGLIVEAGNDVAVVVDLDGVRRIIARPVPPLPSKANAATVAEQKAKPAAKEPSTAPAPVAGA